MRRFDLKPSAGVGAITAVWTPQQGLGHESGRISRAAGLQMLLNFLGYIVGQRQQPGLVKLGGLDQQRVVARLVVLWRQAEQFTATKPVV